ncbi:hypothetical protein BIW22_24905 [Salmonella enterica]|nr:hypothetical protein [Salmonella enterica]
MKKSIIAVTIITAITGMTSANAQLSGADLVAANAYIAQHPGIPHETVSNILKANNLTEANYPLTGYSYYTGYNNGNKVVFPGTISPVATTSAVTTPVASNPTITTQQEAYRHVDRFAMRPVTADSTSAQLAHNPLYAGREVGNNAQIAVRADALRTLGQTGNEVAPHPISIAPLNQQKLESQRVANRVADDEQAFQAQIDSQPAKPAYAPTPTSLKTNLHNAQIMYARIEDKTSPAAVKLESTIRSIYGQMQTLNAQLAANEHISTGDEVTRHDVRMLSVVDKSAPVVHAAAPANMPVGMDAATYRAATQNQSDYDRIQNMNISAVKTVATDAKDLATDAQTKIDAVSKVASGAQSLAANAYGNTVDLGKTNVAQDKAIDAHTAQITALVGQQTTQNANIASVQQDVNKAQHDADEAYGMAQGLTKDIVETQAKVADVKTTADEARTLAVQAGASGAQNTQDINTNKDAIAQETTDRTTAVAGVQTQVTDNKTAIDGQTTRIDDNAAAIAINASGIKLNSNTLGLLNQDIKDAGVNIQTNKDAIATKVDTTTYDAGQKAQDQAISDVDGKADANKAEIATNKAEQANTDQSQNKNLLLVAGRVDQNTVWIRDNAAAQALVDGNQDKATADNTQEINTNAGNIATNKTAAATNAGNIATNKTAIATNTSSIVTLQSGVKQAQDTGAYAQSRADAAFQHAEDNKAALAATNKTVSSHTAELANHESRIQDLEAKNSANFGKLKNEVDQNRKRASAGIAGVAAMANIPQVIQGQTFSIGAGVGNTDGESALAVGMSARASEHVVVKTSVSSDTQHNFVVGAGVSYGW